MKTIEVKVHAIRLQASTIHSFELRSASETALPPFTAGAHVEVHMSEHLVRSYSLVNSPAETDRYVIAVNKDAGGRGGSIYMHDQVRVGQMLRISEPRNNFELAENAAHTVLIAGGIGITPLFSMISRMRQLDRPWTLHYCGRDRASMAYVREVQDLKRAGADVHLHVDAENNGLLLSFAKVLEAAPVGSHYYCCGPKPMLAAFEEATCRLPPDHVHVEYFVAKDVAAADGGYLVQLAKSGRTFPVLPGSTILNTLLDAGVDVGFSCMEGICGSCETKVVSGVPDHRDAVLSKSERDANDKMMICCSGSKTSTLVLDL